jgi:hypothetical protein
MKRDGSAKAAITRQASHLNRIVRLDDKVGLELRSPKRRVDRQNLYGAVAPGVAGHHKQAHRISAGIGNRLG